MDERNELERGWPVRGGLRAMAPFGAAVLLLTGCESAVDGSGSGSNQPVSGGSITVASSADAIPGQVLGGKAGNQPWAANVFQTLTVDNEAHEPQPLLAESWELADDATSIDIELRDDVTFSTGRELTAEDVKFTLEKSADPASASQTAFIAQAFRSIEVTSPTSLSIQFDRPIPYVFDLFEQAFIVDPETYEGLADGSQAVVGMNTSDVQTFVEDPQYSILSFSGSVYPLGLNVEKRPLDDKSVRQAINYAIDRERINDQVFGGAGTAADLYRPADLPGSPKDLAGHYTYDPERAKAMIEDAGATGAEIPITVIDLPNNTSAAEIVRNNLQGVGVKPSINIVDVPTFAEDQIAGNLGTAFMPLHGLIGFGAATLVNTLPSLRAGQNASKFDTPAYSRLLEQLQSATNEEGTATALEELTTYMLDEAFTSVIVAAPGQAVVSTSVVDATVTTRGYLDLSRAYSSSS